MYDKKKIFFDSNIAKVTKVIVDKANTYCIQTDT